MLLATLSYLHIGLIFIALFLVLILFFLWFKNFYKLHSLKFRVDASQKAELIKGKMFITKDQYHLAVNQKMVPKSKYLILGIHDFKTNKDEFLNLQAFLDEQNEYSYLFYDQRNVGANKPVNKFNQASLLADLDAIINDLLERYDQELIIVASGISASAAMYFSSTPRIAKIIVPNITLNLPYKSRVGLNFSKFFYNLLSLNGVISQPYSGYDFAKTKAVAQELDKLNLESGLWTYQEYLQNKKMQKKLVKNINNATNQVEFYLLNNDFYCNKQKLTKFLTKIKNKELITTLLPDEKHYWVWEADFEKFNFLLKNVN